MAGIVRLLVFACCLALAPGALLAQDKKGYLGIEVRDLTKAEADKLGWDHGALVAADPDKGSPADKAGLKVGDLIIIVDRTPVDTAAEFNAAIAGQRPGSELRLQVVSGGRERRVVVALVERPGVKAADATPILQLDTGGHMSIIKGLAFTPDGRHLVSAGDDKVIRVWDWQAGTTVRIIRGQAGAGPEGTVRTMALSPDGRWLAVGGHSASFRGDNHAEVGAIRLYEFGTGRLVALLKGHANVVNGLAFAPDSKRLISGAGKTAIIWDVERRTLAHRLQGHTNEIYAVGFTPHGARAVTGSSDKTLRLWSAADGRLMATLAGHKDRVWALAVSGADDSIASGSDDGEIRLWDGRTGRFLRTLARQDGDFGALRFSADGRQLLSTCASTCPDNKQRLWDVTTGKELLVYGGHDDTVVAAALSPDGQLVATGGGNNQEIHLWSPTTGRLERRLVGKGAPRSAAALSADGTHLAWGNSRAAGDSSGPQPLAWQLRLAQLGSVLGVPEKVSGGAERFLRARTEHGIFALAHRKGGDYGYAEAILDVTRDGKVQASITRRRSDGLGHNSYTFAPDGQSLISGGSNGIG